MSAFEGTPSPLSANVINGSPLVETSKKRGPTNDDDKLLFGDQILINHPIEGRRADSVRNGEGMGRLSSVVRE